MTDFFATALAFTLSQEGCWADNPADPGGCTMRGITLATFRGWRGEPDATPEMLRAISDAECAAIYRTLYWKPVAGDDLPGGVALSVFDAAVSTGVRQSAVQLQRILRVPADGSIGAQTLRACHRADATEVIASLAVAQLAFYQRLKTWPTFGHGWSNRVKARLAPASGA